MNRKNKNTPTKKESTYTGSTKKTWKKPQVKVLNHNQTMSGPHLFGPKENAFYYTFS